MDSLSVNASFIAAMRESGEVVRLCRAYYQAVKDTRYDILRLENEVLSFDVILSGVVDMITYTESPNNNPSSSILLLLNGAMEKYHNILLELINKLGPGEKKLRAKQAGVRSLKWPFSKNELEYILMGIERTKSTLMLALTADSM